MTITAWQTVLLRYEANGNPSEKLMANMLLSLSQIDNPQVVRLFDAYASEILESEPVKYPWEELQLFGDEV